MSRGVFVKTMHVLNERVSDFFLWGHADLNATQYISICLVADKGRRRKLKFHITIRIRKKECLIQLEIIIIASLKAVLNVNFVLTKITWMHSNVICVV